MKKALLSVCTYLLPAWLAEYIAEEDATASIAPRMLPMSMYFLSFPFRFPPHSSLSWSS
jgi:hypothetical protein